MHFIKAFAVCALLSLCLFATAAAQQAATATLSGQVLDPNKAAVMGAEVSATQAATGIRHSTLTNDEGLYTLTNLPPGLYQLQVIAHGFAERRVSFSLQVGQAEKLDLALDLQGASVNIEISDRLAPVNTTSSVVDNVVNAREIQSLPLNGRNFLELALLAPGNSPAPNFDPTKTNTVLISSAGQLGRGSNVMIDGADNNDDVVGGTLQNISQDAVQEFQIATNRFSAELGRSASSVVNVVTRSGTNEFHGSASFFERDNKLQSQPARGGDVPFDRQQYSVALGGPVKRDKLFWFGSFEYRNQDGAVQVGTRDAATRTILSGFAVAPLNDLLGTARLDWSPDATDSLSFRYSIERADDVAASTLIRQIGSASQRQSAHNNYQAVTSNWTRTLSSTAVNEFRFSFNNFFNRTEPITTAPQLTFPSVQDGASFRVPQSTRQNRFQLNDNFTLLRGNHTLRFGGEMQRVDADFDLGVFRQGRIEFVEDFASLDRNGDGVINDNDLLFAVTLRSATPNRSLVIPDADNNHFAFYFQDDWRVRPRLTLNLGLRYELDTDVKNVSRVDELNPLILPFLRGQRGRDLNNFGPRVGFNYSTSDGRFSLHGGYGIYYDRVVLEIQSLERGLDGRALAVEVRAGNALRDPAGVPVFLNPDGTFRPGAPTLLNPFSGFILPGAGASGINIIDNDVQNPMVQQMNFGVQWEFMRDFVARADYLHNFGTHFLIGRTVGTVFNPVVGGPDRVVNLESSAKFKYDGMLLSLEKRVSHRYQFRASYTLSKAFNYANDDQIPFSSGPLDPNDLQREYGPTPNDQRHRFTFAGTFELPWQFQLSPIVTLASGVPMDILLPDASTRVPQLQRNAGGRIFKTGAELNDFLRAINAAGGVGGQPLPLVADDVRFNDSFSSFDLRLSKTFAFNDRFRLEPIIEVFNLFNTTNVLGVSNVNYSGFSNVLARDSNDPASPGFLRSSGFGRPVTTAGGIFGSGGPRAFQVAARFIF
ncbi:MAG: TonB-dependent receptor [Acidobacteria bacterium]|nr:TonB-dependent receptor [Acidobacteriota bacterium]